MSMRITIKSKSALFAFSLLQTFSNDAEQHSMNKQRVGKFKVKCHESHTHTLPPIQRSLSHGDSQ